MAMYNSFYGGRRGASFVLVKNYLDIPQMVNDFAKGSGCTDVAFEEYVLINNPQKNHPDNGKIFRRGYDFNSNKTITGYVLKDKNGQAISADDPAYMDVLKDTGSRFDPYTNIQAHGAEYIGSIVGPAGKAPLLNMTSYEQVQNMATAEGFKERKSSGSYSPSGDNPGLIPGKDKNGNYNDAIKWQCYSVSMDKLGDETQAYIGFKFPYLVTQMSTQQVAPYNVNGDIDDMSGIIKTDDGEHPYYNKWKLSIPKGVKGDTFKNLRVTTFNNYADNANNSSDKQPLYYYDENGEAQILINPAKQPNGEFDKTFFQKKYGTDVVTEGITLIDLLTKLADKSIYVYEIHNYDAKQSGKRQYFYLGDYNEIESIELTDEGQLKITFAHDGEKTLTTEENPIKWIKNISLSSTFNPVYNGEQQDVIVGGSFPDDEPYKNFQVTYNNDTTQQFNLPYVKRILYENGKLWYQLAGIHHLAEGSESVYTEENELNAIEITDLTYVNGLNFDSEQSKLTFTKNAGDSIEVLIPVIKEVRESNGKLIAQFKNKTPNIETIAEIFKYFTKFEYDADNDILKYQLNTDSEQQQHRLKFINGLRYNTQDAQIQYRKNDGQTDEATKWTNIGSLPLIKNMTVVDDNKNILVQFGSEVEGFTRYSEGEYANGYWYVIGNAVSEQVVTGGIIMNYTKNELAAALQNSGETSSITDLESLIERIQKYGGVGAYDNENPNPVIEALNQLYPTGAVSNQEDAPPAEFSVITFGNDKEDKEYFGFSRLPSRQGADGSFYGSWYYIGKVTQVGNVAFDIEGSAGNYNQGSGNILFVKEDDIVTISVNDQTGLCSFSNPITKIQKNHKYVNIISKPSTLNNISITVTIGDQSQTNVYDTTTGRIQIPADKVSNNIIISISLLT